MTTAYAVRVDAPLGMSDMEPKIKKWLLKMGSEKSFFVMEDVEGNNLHIQGLTLIPTKHKKAAVRTYLKTCVWGKGAKVDNGHYSLKILKPEDPQEFPFRQYEQYLCKGKHDDLPRVVESITTLAYYTDGLVNEYHDLYWTVAAQLKKRKLRLYDEVLDKSKRGRFERREEIARVVFDIYLEQEKPMNVTSMRGLANLVYAKVCPDKETAAMTIVDMIMERRDIMR